MTTLLTYWPGSAPLGCVDVNPTDGRRLCRNHCVVTATLVEPRTTPPESLNCTLIRLTAGEKATAPAAVAKTAKVGVALALIWTLGTVAAIGVMQVPAAGSVWHIVIESGKAGAVAAALAVIA